MNVNSFLIFIYSINYCLHRQCAFLLCIFIYLFIYLLNCVIFLDTDMISLGNELLIVFLCKFAMVILNFLQLLFIVYSNANFSIVIEKKR